MLQVGQWIPGSETIANMKKTPGQPSQGTITGRNSEQSQTRASPKFYGDSKIVLLPSCLIYVSKSITAKSKRSIVAACSLSVQHLAIIFMNHQLLQILLLVCLNTNNHRMTYTAETRLWSFPVMPGDLPLHHQVILQRLQDLVQTLVSNFLRSKD